MKTLSIEQENIIVSLIKQNKLYNNNKNSFIIIIIMTLPFIHSKQIFFPFLCVAVAASFSVIYLYFKNIVSI